MDDKTKEKLKYYNRLSSLYFNGIIASISGMGACLLIGIGFKILCLAFICAVFLVLCIARHQYCNEMIDSLIK